MFFVSFLFRVRSQEKAQQGNTGAAGSEPQSSPSEAADEPAPDGTEASRLLDWPQLELERVNSFLTSRLEEIKNTIKDSIRASFSMYDLNLDVNDFPKKAATLEGNHLLSHLNGSSDLQQIDLDLAPLSLGSFKNHLDLVNGWEDTNTNNNTTTITTTNNNNTTAPGVTVGSKDIQRLHNTPSLSKLIRVRSPERGTAIGTDSLPQVPPIATAKSKEDAPDPKNAVAGNSSGKSKKNKKQQQKQEQPELNSSKTVKAAVSRNEVQRASETKENASNGTKVMNKQQQQQHHHSADSQKNGLKKTEESRSSKHAANGANGGLPNAQRGKGDTDARAGRCEQDAEIKTPIGIPANGQQQQSKGKNKKSKNKGEKSSSAIGMTQKMNQHLWYFFLFLSYPNFFFSPLDDVFLPKDVDPTEMDEIDREVEYFKR